MSFRNRVWVLAGLLAWVVLGIRQQLFVDRFAVNVLYWDGWELYQPMFEGRGWWAFFALQHGPHRQGVGGLLMGVLAIPSHLNARWDAFSVSWALIMAALLGIWVAVRCGVRGWGCVAVPLIYLNIRQCHMFIATANPSHGALPVLLLTIFCLVCFLRAGGVRRVLMCGVTFLLIFTGFGLFAGLITPVLFVVEMIRVMRGPAPNRGRQIVGLTVAIAAVALSWGIFVMGYSVHAPGIIIAHSSAAAYFGFIGALIANFFGLGQSSAAAVAGLILFAVLCGICVHHFIRLIRLGEEGNAASVVVFFLSAFAILFSTQSAEGRVGFGWQAGAASRYVTLMIPMAMALLIHLSTTPALVRFQLPLIFTGLLAVGTTTLSRSEMDGVQHLHDKCLQWQTAYLATGDQPAADRLTGFQIYEGDLSGQLGYLRQHKLNLFDAGQR